MAKAKPKVKPAVKANPGRAKKPQPQVVPQKSASVDALLGFGVMSIFMFLFLFVFVLIYKQGGALKEFVDRNKEIASFQIHSMFMLFFPATIITSLIKRTLEKHTGKDTGSSELLLGMSMMMWSLVIALYFWVWSWSGWLVVLMIIVGIPGIFVAFAGWNKIKQQNANLSNVRSKLVQRYGKRP